jgi:tetratricopeptide (TPR) repeat protein
MIGRVLLPILMLLSIATTAQTRQISDTQDMADSLYYASEYAAALTKYERLLQTDSRNSYLLCQAGLCLYEQENFQKAKEKFRLAALYCSPDNKKSMALYYTNLSACFSNLNNDEKAFEYAIKAYLMEETSDAKLWNAASMAQNLGKYDDCIKIMDNAKIERDHAFLTLYGRCYIGKGQYDKAIESYESFFSVYSPTDDFVKFDIKSEQNQLSSAYLHAIAIADVDMQKVDTYISKIKILWLHQRDGGIEREDVISAFFTQDNICSKYNYSTEVCSKLFNALLADASATEKIQFGYYVLHDYSATSEMAERLLQDHTKLNSEELSQTKFIHYLANLHLFVQNLRGDPQANPDQLQAMQTLFDSLFEKGKIYSDEEFHSETVIYKAMQETFMCFQSHFKGKEAQQEAAPILLNIIKNLPNEKARLALTDMLSEGHIQD